MPTTRAYNEETPTRTSRKQRRSMPSTKDDSDRQMPWTSMTCCCKPISSSSVTRKLPSATENASPTSWWMSFKTQTTFKTPSSRNSQAPTHTSASSAMTHKASTASEERKSPIFSSSHNATPKHERSNWSATIAPPPTSLKLPTASLHTTTDRFPRRCMPPVRKENRSTSSPE